MLTYKRLLGGVARLAPVAALVLLGSGGVTATRASRASAGPVQVTFFAAPDPTIVNLDTNWYTKYVDKTYNLKIKWITAPQSDVATKSTVLVNSGDYPEVFYNGSFTIPEVYKYAKQGVFVPLESYFQKYAPNVWHALQVEPGLKQALTAPDGHIYGLPNYNLCLHCDYAAKFWIDVQKLKQYGLQVPKTTADFEHVLQVFKQHGLNPLTGAATGGWHTDPTTFLMNSFIYDDGGPANNGNYFYIDNGKLAFAANQPQWKAGLAYIHTLFSQGLIDQGAFSQANSALQKQVATGKVGVVPWGCPQCFDTNYAKHVNMWRSLAPLTGPNGVHYSGFFGNSPGSPIVFAVTNKATDAQKIAVAKMLNGIWTVPYGMGTMQFGPPSDKLWTPYPKGQVGMNGKPAMLAVNTMYWNTPNVHQNWSWYQMGPMYVNYAYRYGLQAYAPYAPGGIGAESMLQLETEENYVGNQPQYVAPGALWVDPSSLNQFTLAQTNINNYVTQWTAQFITGSKSLDTDWNSYVQGLQGLGLSQYLATAQQAMGKPMNTLSGTLFKKDMVGIRFLSSLKP